MVGVDGLKYPNFEVTSLGVGSSEVTAEGFQLLQKAWGSACCGPNKASSQLRAPASSTGVHTGPAQGQASCGRGPTSMASERNP